MNSERVREFNAIMKTYVETMRDYVRCFSAGGVFSFEKEKNTATLVDCSCVGEVRNEATGGDNVTEADVVIGEEREERRSVDASKELSKADKSVGVNFPPFYSEELQEAVNSVNKARRTVTEGEGFNQGERYEAVSSPVTSVDMSPIDLAVNRGQASDMQIPISCLLKGMTIKYKGILEQALNAGVLIEEKGGEGGHEVVTEVVTVTDSVSAEDKKKMLEEERRKESGRIRTAKWRQKKRKLLLETSAKSCSEEVKDSSGEKKKKVGKVIRKLTNEEQGESSFSTEMQTALTSKLIPTPVMGFVCAECGDERYCGGAWVCCTDCKVSWSNPRCVRFTPYRCKFCGRGK